MTDFPALGFDPAPGDAAGVKELAERYRRISTKLGSAADTLDTVASRTGLWSGDAADAFLGNVNRLPEYLGTAVESTSSASSALGGWATTLRELQRRAEELELRARQAAAEAVAARDDPALDLAGQEFFDPGSLGAAQQLLDAAQARLGAAVDELEAIQEAAHRLKDQHTEAAENAADELGQAGDLAPEHERGGLGGVIDDVGGALDSLPDLVSGTSGAAGASGPNGSWGLTGPEFTGETGGPAFGTDRHSGQPTENDPGFELGLGGIEGEYNVAEASASGETNVGGVDLAGSAEASLGMQGTATASITEDGLEVGAEGSIGARASVEGSADYGILGANAQGEAFAGAEASAGLTAGADGLEAKAEAFAGGRAEGSAGADVGGVGAGVSGEAWAGVGAEASATFGRGEDGKWHIGGEFGAALGVGGEFGGEITIDPGEVIDTAGQAADAVTDFAGGARDRVGDVVGSLNPF